MATKRKSVSLPSASNKKPTRSRSFLSRMSPKLLHSFVNSPSLSEKQITDIKHIGFGGLLSLKTDFVPGNLASWLCTHLDVPKASLMDGQLRILDSDIFLATGLPMGSIPIIESKKREKSEEELKIISDWKKQFGAESEDVTKNMLYEKMLQQVDGGDDFKRNFVVLAVATLLNGVKGVKPSLRIIHCLKDVSQISSLNWCLYTLQNMLNHVKAWQIGQKSGNPPAFKGPIIVLLMIYLDRVCFKFRTVPRTFPILSSWTPELIRQRINLELKEATVFGKGSVDGRLDHPLPIKTPETPTREVSLDVDVNMAQGKRSLENLVGATGELCTSLNQFLDALHTAEDVLPNAHLITKMTALGDGLVTATQVVVPEKECVQPEPNMCPQVPEVPLDDDPFFSRPDVVEQLLKLENVCKVFPKVRRVRKFRNMVIGTSSPGPVSSQDPTCPSFKLFSSQDFPPTPDDKGKAPEESVQVVRPHTSETLPDTEETIPDTEETLPDTGETLPDTEETLPDTEETVPDTEETLPDTEETLSDTPVTPSDAFLANSGSPQHHSTIVPYNTESKSVTPNQRPTRNTNLSYLFRSPFIQRNVDVLGNLTQVEKEFSDFAFAKLDESEILYTSDHYTLLRSDLKTLMPGEKVANEIVAVWCDFLNDREKLRGSSSPLRLFLSRKTCVNLNSIDFNGISLVFVPIVYPTPLLFVVHFRKSTIEVVSPTEVGNFNPQLVHAVELVNRHLGEKLVRCKPVSGFKVQVYVPPSNIGYRVDRGLYLMRHMETYQGKRAGYKSGLTDATCLKRLSVKYCHLLLTFKGNSVKDKVSEAVTDFKTRMSVEPFEGIPNTDSFLLDFVRGGEFNSDVLIDTEWMQVIRGGLKTLLPGQFVMDMVIDIVGIKATLNKREFMYFPTTIRFVHPNGPRNTIHNQYIKTHYLPKNANHVERLFFPINTVNHWYVCIADFSNECKYILDSNPNRRGTKRINHAITLVNNVVDIMSKDPHYRRLSLVKAFTVMPITVPQQKTSFDCGVYVIKWLQALHDDTLWNSEDYLVNFEDVREEVMVDLLRWEKNKRKVFEC